MTSSTDVAGARPEHEPVAPAAGADESRAQHRRRGRRRDGPPRRHAGTGAPTRSLNAAIKTAKYEGYGPDDLVATVATDGASMYATEIERILARDFGGTFDDVAAGETFGRFVLGAGTDDLLELTRVDRDRIFNLGYFTWVEQQGVPIEEFEARRRPEFWAQTRAILPVWDERIEEFNDRVAAAVPA